MQMITENHCVVGNLTFTNYVLGLGPRLGMFGVGNPTCTNYLLVFGPRPGMSGVGNPTFTDYF